MQHHRAEEIRFGDSPAPSQEHLIQHSCLSSKYLELIVFPTEQCNFRCTYCYEDFAIGAMKQPIINGICRLIDQRAPGLDALKISYFGGEPLLNMKAVRHISSYAQSISISNGFRYISNATTNGYLLDVSRMEELISLGCDHFQISLDGWGDTHDRTRRARNQLGTFIKIWANLIALRSTSLDFNVILRVHMSPENARSLTELVANINHHLDDDRFRILFKKVGNWGGKHKDHPDVYQHGSIDAAVLHKQLLDQAKRVYDFGIDETGGNVTPSDSAKVVNDFKRVGIPPICYAAKSNSLAIRANGRINKCTVALSNPSNDIGFLDESGNLHIDGEKMTPWIQGALNLDHAALACPAAKIAQSAMRISADAP